MAKPYILWDASLNADLWKRASQGPLLLQVSDPATAAELQALKNLITQTTRPVLFNDEEIGYQQDVSYGYEDVVNKGVKVYQNEYLPSNLEFGLPGPDPYDESNVYGGHKFRLANLGYQLMLRGWVGTMQEGALTGEFKIAWSDEDLRISGDAIGAWTGITLDVSNRDAERSDHKFDILHGKRVGEADWHFHGGHLNRDPGGSETINEDTSTYNNLSSSVMRIIIGGGSPNWTITLQKQNGAAWDDVHTMDVDLRSHLTGDSDEVALMMSFFSALTVTRPGILPSEFYRQSIWGSQFELSQFEPWIIDTSSWSERGWDEHWRWLTGSTKVYGLELARPKTDLIHSPMGTAAAPDELRVSDADMGICTRVGIQTKLRATGISDNRYIDPDIGPAIQPIAVCDQLYLGSSAPFAAYIRLKMLSAGSWGEERSLFSFGDTSVVSPTSANNGISLFWRSTTGSSGKFIVKYFDTVLGWSEIETEETEAAQWSDKLLDIGFAWTGLRGSSAGLGDRQLRIVINGITVAQVNADNFALSNSKEMHVGADQSMSGASYLFRSMAVYGDPVTNSELEKSFEAPQDAFGNESFEIPGEHNRPGDADLWDWFSLQSTGAWAEFNTYDESLRQWMTSTEEFGPGWFNLQSWIDDLSQTDVNIAIFNGGSSVYETLFEMFGLWGKQWPSLEWAGSPWRDDFVYLQPMTDVLGADNGPTGFNGWYDRAFLTNYIPNEQETFGDGSETDPFSSSMGALWYPGTAKDGCIKGNPLTVPVIVPPDKNTLIVWIDGEGVIELQMTPGTYIDVADLAQELNDRMSGYSLQFEGMEFITWEHDGDSGLALCKKNTNIPVSVATMFGCREKQKGNDVREFLGFSELGPKGRQSEIKAMRWMLGDLHGENSEDIFCLDSWSLLEFSSESDNILSKALILEYSNVAAIFDTALGSSEKTALEQFRLNGWFGASANWQTGYMSGNTPGVSGIEAALFTEGAGTTSFENFEAADWPNEIWT